MYYNVLYCVIHYFNVIYYIILYYIALYCDILYCTRPRSLTRSLARSPTRSLAPSLSLAPRSLAPSLALRSLARPGPPAVQLKVQSGLRAATPPARGPRGSAPRVELKKLLPQIFHPL